MQIDNTLQQITDLLSSGSIQKLLITSGKNDDPDAVGSILALAAALQPQIATIVLAIEDFDSQKYAFLPGADRISSSVGQKSLVVSIDVGASPIEKINYNAQDTTFNLILTPKSGQLDVDQIQYSYTGVDYDAIIVVDTAKKELLGRWIEDFAEELRDIPIINLDHHQDNQQFGSVNFIQAKAPAATVVVHQLLQALQLPVTAEIATYLLAGLLADTSGFANSNATAASLRLAADLVDNGADLHQTMTGLFRSMSLSAMRLWGKVLSSIQLKDPGILITQLTLEDISSAQASDADVATLGSLVNNILVADRSAQLAVMLKDKGEGEVSGSLRAIADLDVAAIARQLGGGGHVKAAGFRLKQTTMEEAKEQVLKTIQQNLKSEPNRAAADPSAASKAE
jgi:phosphoesterase RecJ-like protein